MKTDTYRVNIGPNKYRRFGSLQAATDYCAGYFDQSGIVLAIEHVRPDVPNPNPASEPSCCSVARKLGGKKCPICRTPIRLAKVLRLLRHDARSWWYYRQLRTQGRTELATELERESVRSNVRFIRQNINRSIRTYRTDVIEFTDRPRTRPFDLSVVKEYGGQSFTAMVSGCHPGGFAAFVYCYANRIGIKYQAKATDLI